MTLFIVTEIILNKFGGNFIEHVISVPCHHAILSNFSCNVNESELDSNTKTALLSSVDKHGT